MVHLHDSLKMLVDQLGAFKIEITRVTQGMNVGVWLTDIDEKATLVISEDIEIQEDLKETSFDVMMTKEIFEKILSGEADAFALAGRAKLSESRPVDFEIHNKDNVSEIMEVLKALMTFLFNPGILKSKALDVKLAGSAHGAKPIPLVYWKGLRYAWYHVSKGTTLNEECEHDPWPQVFVVLAGEGILIIGDNEEVLETNKTYYIPRNSLHQIKAETDVQLLWLAWDAP
ncbi:MAG: cupin domain-containing protein [Candidatus Lokiarchaeota archaeon]|nr:cupin domain-containing protein [Candidatus Lokiarchaeota archaeon]